MRLNIWGGGFRRPEPRTHTRTFRDPAQPGAELTLTLRELNGCEQFAAVDYGAALANDWAAPDTLFPCPDGSTARLTQSLCQLLAFLEWMQVPAEGEAPYGFPELVGIALVFPTAIREIAAWVGEINSPPSAGGLAGNPPGAAGSTA